MDHITPEQASRGDVSLAMVILASEKKNVMFGRRGVHITPVDAMMFQSVVQDLLKVSTFCVNMHAELNFRQAGRQKTTVGEDILLAAGIDYAIDICPRAPDEEGDGKQVIDIDDLRNFVARIEKAFGVISIDMSFPEEINAALRTWNQQKMGDLTHIKIASMDRE